MKPRRPVRPKKSLPPGLRPEHRKTCARCGLAYFMHHQYWASTVGADHRPVPKKREEP